jgi:hypothetical protein
MATTALIGAGEGAVSTSHNDGPRHARLRPYPSFELVYNGVRSAGLSYRVSHSNTRFVALHSEFAARYASATIW